MPLFDFENDTPEWLRRKPAPGTLGWLTLALTLGTAAAVGLHAPQSVWIVCAVLAVLVFVAALIGHFAHEREADIGQVAVLPDPALAARNMQRDINDARHLARDLLRLRGNILDDHRINTSENAVARGVYKRIYARQYGARAAEMFEAGRAWGFFHPDEKWDFEATSNMGVLRTCADRLEEFAVYLEGRQHT
jgi:hypothetical protein